MARFTGPQHRGATRKARDKRRLEAEVRNALYQRQKATRPAHAKKGGTTR